MGNQLSNLLLTTLIIFFSVGNLNGQTNEPVYVIGPAKDTLWAITSYSGIFSPEARAEAIQTNLERILNDSEWDSKKLLLENRGLNIDLIYNFSHANVSRNFYPKNNLLCCSNLSSSDNNSLRRAICCVNPLSFL